MLALWITIGFYCKVRTIRTKYKYQGQAHMGLMQYTWSPDTAYYAKRAENV